MGPDRWFNLAIAVFATWRLAHLFAMEDGPADVIVSLRVWLSDGFFGKLMDCFYCLSLWVAAPIAVLLGHGWRERVVLWMALSGAACLLERSGSPTVTHHFPAVEGED